MTLASYRESKGLTQEQAAAELDLKSKGYFSRLEQGEPVPIRVALRIQAWSAGEIQAVDLVSDDDRKLLEDADAFRRVAA